MARLHVLQRTHAAKASPAASVSQWVDLTLAGLEASHEALSIYACQYMELGCPAPMCSWCAEPFRMPPPACVWL